jgi:hypothetical protein
MNDARSEHSHTTAPSHIRVDDRGTHGVHANTGFRVLNGGGFGKPDHPMLAFE